jgi:5'(3')-deoxyribonucleotidase
MQTMEQREIRKREGETTVGLEAEVFGHIKNAVLDMAEEALSHSLSRYPVHGTTSYKDIMMSQFHRAGDYLRPDIFVHYVSCENSILCGEFKFVTCDVSIDLNAPNGVNGSNGRAMRKDKHRPFEQLYGYMTMNHLRYGFLTNGNVLRCLKKWILQLLIKRASYWSHDR